tara:strand:+ start:2889 stop:3317 length:429 start_codon:yes stop_codon:yes gene_type:complete
MDGMWQDIIIMMTIGVFGLWIITKHYDNAWKIEQLEIKVKKNGKIVSQDEEAIIKDLRQMQTDIIKLQQDCINIDSKYRIKDEWTVNKVQQITDIQEKLVEFMDSCEIPSEGDVVEVQAILDKMAEKGLTMSQAADMESNDV